MENNVPVKESPKENVIEREKKSKFNWSKRLFAISLVVMLLSSAFASYLQSDGGKVRITEALIPTSNGGHLSVLIYKPETATKTTPAPAVICAHGSHNNKEMQDAVYIELSRRGFVVYSMDMFYHGKSSGTSDPTPEYTRDYYGMGMLELVDYVSTMDYVDASRIGITGHSTGGRIVSYTLNTYGRNEMISKGIKEGAVYANQPKDTGKYTTKVASALIVANIPAPAILESFPKGINVGIVVGLYDEGIPLQVTKIDGHYPGDMTVSPQIKNFINIANPNTFKLNKSINYNTKTGIPEVKLTDWDVNQKVEPGKYYGNPKDGTLRVVYNPSETHPWNHFSNETTQNVINYFNDTLHAPKQIPATDQVFKLKEIVNFVGLIGFFIFILQFAYVLLKSKYFESLTENIPEKLPRLTASSKIRTAAMVLITGLTSYFSYVPFMGKIASKIFGGTINNNLYFEQGTSTSRMMVWAIFNGLVALVLFLVNYFVFQRKEGVSIKQWGIKVSKVNILKTILFAALVVTTAYCVIGLNDFFFKTDYRLWIVSAKMPSADNVRVALKYAPFFFVFFAINSLVLNATFRISGLREWKSIGISVITNILGPVIGIALQYITLFATGQVYSISPSWVFFLWLIPLATFLGISAVYARKIFNKTGNIWLPAIINTLIVLLMQCANTQTHTLTF